MENVITASLCLGVLAVLTLAIVRFQRSLDEPGGRDGLGSIGDAFGNMIEVFDPAQARAALDLKSEQHKGPITPSPDDDFDRPVHVVNGPDGRPHAVRVRRSAGSGD
jgi:hypothetical protein